MTSTCSPCCVTSKPIHCEPASSRGPRSIVGAVIEPTAWERPTSCSTHWYCSTSFRHTRRFVNVAGSQLVHQGLTEPELDAVRRSVATGLPYGSPEWVNRLAKRLDLDLTIRPRGRPRKRIDPS